MKENNEGEMSNFSVIEMIFNIGDYHVSTKSIGYWVIYEWIKWILTETVRSAILIPVEVSK